MKRIGLPPEGTGTPRAFPDRRGPGCSRPRLRRGEEGYSLTELTVAVVVLSLGMLGLAGTTALVVRQSLLADVVSERALALQTAIETVRASPFDEIGSGASRRGRFRTTWRVTASTGLSKTLEVITVGPGGRSGGSGLYSDVADTLVYRIVRP